MRVVVSAFVLGVVAASAVTVVVVAAFVAVASASSRTTAELELLGITFVGYERTASGTATTFGSTLALLPLVAGVANAAAAAAIVGGRGRWGR